MPCGSKPVKPTPKPQKPTLARKYRASCDDCSVSKVKCTQERPTCHRCANLGLSCKYSLSLRRGKPKTCRRTSTVTTVSTVGEGGRASYFSPEGSKKPLLSKQEIETQSAPPSMDRWNFSEQLAASSFILRTPNSETATPLPWQDTFTLEDITENSFMDSNRSPSVCFPQSMLSMPADCLLNGSLDMADSPPMANHWGDTQLNPSAFSQQIYECEGSLQSPPGLFHHPDLSSEPLFGRASGLQPSSIGPDGSHDCMSLAFTALHSLYSPPTSAVSTPNCKPMPTMPTIDQILTTNKTAISQVSTLLNCSASCSHDPHFPLLVAVTTSKILAWYQAMGRVTTSSSSISSHESSGSASENVMHMPITLGMYKLDGEDEERMRIQLILSELRKVENLVELFVERFCRTTDSSRDGGGLGMHMALGAFLRARMRETFSETIRERRDLSQRDGGG